MNKNRKSSCDVSEHSEQKSDGSFLKKQNCSGSNGKSKVRGETWSYLLLNEGMLQGLVDGDAFRRVQHQSSVYQILELHDFLPLVLR